MEKPGVHLGLNLQPIKRSYLTLGLISPVLVSPIPFDPHRWTQEGKKRHIVGAYYPFKMMSPVNVEV